MRQPAERSSPRSYSQPLFDGVEHAELESWDLSDFDELLPSGHGDEESYPLGV